MNKLKSSILTVLAQSMYLHGHYLQETLEILFVVKELSQNVFYLLIIDIILLIKLHF